MNKSEHIVCKCGNIVTEVTSCNGDYVICKQCNEVNFK